jgi:hypothetical protein
LAARQSAIVARVSSTTLWQFVGRQREANTPTPVVAAPCRTSSDFVVALLALFAWVLDARSADPRACRQNPAARCLEE